MCLTEFDHLRPAYLRINPDGLVPALDGGEGVLVESSVINAFLDESYGKQRLHPQSPMDRARMRWWCHHEDTVVHPAIRPPTFNLYIKPLLSKLSPEAMEQKIASHPLPERAAAYRSAMAASFDKPGVIASIRNLDRTIARMEIELNHDAWLAGSTFSLADIAMVPLVDRLEMLGLVALWEAHPNAQQWARRVAERPSFAVARGPRVQNPPSAVDRALVNSLSHAAISH